MVTGLSHITLIVKDIDASTALLQQVFGAKLLYDSGERHFSLSRERFFAIAGIWLCIMQGEALPCPTYNHIAFSIADSEYDCFLERILALGLEVLPGRPRVEGEGRSIYFYDYDRHLFELHTGTLEERLERYGK